MQHEPSTNVRTFRRAPQPLTGPFRLGDITTKAPCLLRVRRRTFEDDILLPHPLPHPPANGEVYTLEELQAAVGGDVEFLDVFAIPFVLVVDADGLGKGLPVNMLASRFYQEAPFKAHLVRNARVRLHGDVLVCPASMIR